MTKPTSDQSANARKYARMTQLIAWLTELCVFDTTSMAAQIQAQRRAEALALRAAGNLFTASAIEAAVERHVAAKALLEVDGSATFSASGRAHEALMRALEFHRRASEVDRLIHAEEQRILRIKAAEGTL